MPQLPSDVKDDTDRASSLRASSGYPLLLSAVLSSETKSSRRRDLPCPMPGHSCVTSNEYLVSSLESQTG